MAQRMTTARLDLRRDQILGHRRATGALDARLPPGSTSLRRAAWAGLADSMPRAALLSIHARVEGPRSDAWEDPALVQVWGPRYSAYVVAAEDRAVFTLGRLPHGAAGQKRAESTADALERFLGGRIMPYAEAGRGMGINANALRYGAPTGRLLIRWEGARSPLIWTVPAPTMTADDAALELVRRFLHVLGPGTVTGFAGWAGIATVQAKRTFSALGAALTPVRTPIGDGWILTDDEGSFRMAPAAGTGTAAVRLLPSGDAYTLRWGVDRDLLVPDSGRRPQLWTPRVWPGALLIDGEIAGIWRRAGAVVDVEAWRRLSPTERHRVEAEAVALPLPETDGVIRVRWAD